LHTLLHLILDDVLVLLNEIFFCHEQLLEVFGQQNVPVSGLFHRLKAFILELAG